MKIWIPSTPDPNFQILREVRELSVMGRDKKRKFSFIFIQNYLQ
jgi:hypothetical protein